METGTDRGQVLLETIITLTLFLSLTLYIWTHLEARQNLIRHQYNNHEVKYETK